MRALLFVTFVFPIMAGAQSSPFHVDIQPPINLQGKRCGPTVHDIQIKVTVPTASGGGFNWSNAGLVESGQNTLRDCQTAVQTANSCLQSISGVNVKGFAIGANYNVNSKNWSNDLTSAQQRLNSTKTTCEQQFAQKQNICRAMLEQVTAGYHSYIDRLRSALNCEVQQRQEQAYRDLANASALERQSSGLFDQAIVAYNARSQEFQLAQGGARGTQGNTGRFQTTERTPASEE